MTISTNSRTGGFREWAQAHDPKRVGEVRAAADGGHVLAAPAVGHGAMTPDEQPHRPWLVPGMGKL